MEDTDDINRLYHVSSVEIPIQATDGYHVLQSVETLLLIRNIIIVNISLLFMHQQLYSIFRSEINLISCVCFVFVHMISISQHAHNFYCILTACNKKNYISFSARGTTSILCFQRTIFMLKLLGDWRFNKKVIQNVCA